jgi:hypothetical protein
MNSWKITNLRTAEVAEERGEDVFSVVLCVLCD